MKWLPILAPERARFWQNLSLKAKLIFSLAAIFIVSSLFLLMQVLKSDDSPLWIALLKVVYSTGIFAVIFINIWKKPRLLYVLPIVLGVLFIVGTDVIDTIPYDSITREMINQKNKICTICAIFTVYTGFLLFSIFIKKEGTAKVKLETEMEMAKKIHDILVPPVSMKTGNIEIQGRSVPIAEMGGDIIDTIVKENETTCIIADVSGHGISAGIVMGTFKSIIHTVSREEISLASMFTRANSVLYELKSKGMFVTAAAIRFLSHSEAEFSVAGHLPILHFQKRSGKINRLNLKQIALGIRPNFNFVSQNICFESGDLFAMVTDGLTETANNQEHLLGIHPLEECIKLDMDKPLAGIDNAVFDLAHNHGTAHDDQTILLIRCL
jgi:serine phosphatase RsbU (regulator of sigma subunit)